MIELRRPTLLAAALAFFALLLAVETVWADGMEEQPPGVTSPNKSASKKPQKPLPKSKASVRITAAGNKTKMEVDKPAPGAATAQKNEPAGNTQPLSTFELEKYQYCGDDRDCVVAVNGCCDCVNGGVEAAVNKDRLDAFHGRFDCLYVQCSHKPAKPPCANGVVSCIDHKCKYFDDVKR